MTRWITYSLIRLGIFTGIFVILLVAGLEWWVSALLATVMAFAVSYIFFYRQRTELAQDLEGLVTRRQKLDRDSESEDNTLDSQSDGYRENNRKDQ